MTRNNQLEAIRAACIKANPEITELKLGCDVIAAHWAHGSFRDTVSSYRRTDMRECREKNLPDWVSGSYVITHGYLQTEDERIAGRREPLDVFRLLEVIGRPIRLADVLLTIGGADIMINTGGQWIKYKGEQEQGFGFIVETACLNAVRTAWNLRQDDLTQQSDECVAFLYELLK